MKRIITLFAVLALIMSCAVFAGYGCKSGADKITTYTIECSLSGEVLTGSETVSFYNGTENTFTELKFNLFGNAFRSGAAYSPISSQYRARAYYNGVNYGDMTIASVKDADGSPLAFEICGEDQNILSVALGKEVFPGETVKVTVDFTLKLAKVIARTGINRKAVNLANFYPILCGIEDGSFYECLYYANGDPFFSDCADYTVTFTADEKYVVAASGKVSDSVVNGGMRTSVYSAKNVRSFAFVLSDKFESVCDTSLGTEITYYFYDDAAPDKSLKAAVDSVRYFENTFGEYPYETFAVVQTEFVQGGMEFPSLVMISDALDEKAYLEVIVHETAHQWWQTAVGNNEIKYGFLDAGLAEYSVVLFYENHPDYGYTRQSCVEAAEKTYKLFCSVYEKLFGGADTSMMRGLGEYSGEYEYVNIAYIKPTIMYDCLRETVGDNIFFKGLKRYYSEYKFKNADPYDLVGVFEKSGADTNGYFESFFDGKVIL